MHDKQLIHMNTFWHGTLRAYLIGFFSALVLTGVAYFVAMTQLLPEPILSYTVVGLALVQAAVQLLFFLHVGQEPKPYWETWLFLFMFVLLIAVVVGSLWVMHDLNSRMMPGM